MTQKEILNEVALIHNCLTQISVRGDDAIRMGDALSKCRKLVYAINQSAQESAEQTEK